MSEVMDREAPCSVANCGGVHFSVVRDDFAQAVALVRMAIGRRYTMPILGHARLTAGDGGLVVESTDLDVMVRIAVPADVAVPGTVTMDARALERIVKAAPRGEALHFTAADGGLITLVEAGETAWRLPGFYPADFPTLDLAPDAPVRMAMPGRTIARGLAFTCGAASREETRYYLNGVYMGYRPGGHHVFVATDGHRLAEVRCDLPDGAMGTPAHILPLASLPLLARLAARAGDDPVTIECGNLRARFTAGAVSVTAKTIDAAYPDYERVMPAAAPTDTWLSADASELSTALARARAFHPDRHTAAALDASPGETLRITIVNPDDGRAETRCAAETSGPAVRVGFKARYLAEALKLLSPGTVEVVITDASAPARFTNRALPGFSLVVMPMRI